MINAQQNSPKNTFFISLAIVCGIIIAWVITGHLEKYAINAPSPATARLRPSASSVPDKTMAYPSSKKVDLKPDPSETGRPIFSSAVTPQQVSTEVLDKETPKPIRPKLVLSGILVSENGNLAIINNQIVGPGDEIKGAKVIEIGLNQVVLSFADQKITLTNR